MRTAGLSPQSHAFRVHTTAKELSPILDNKDHSMFHNGFNCQGNLPQTHCQPDVCEVQPGKMEMFSYGLEVRKGTGSGFQHSIPSIVTDSPCNLGPKH